MAITRFEELQVWQLARALSRRVFRWTRSGEAAKDFAFVTQARRASLSVMNNIAEGFERYRRTEFLQFLSIAKGSAAEVRSMLFAALDIGYLTQRQFDSLSADASDLTKAITRFATRLRSTKTPVASSRSPGARPPGPRTKD
ncbi:MAG: four helix bundle protein [Phycisphaerales bacterium]